MMRFKDRVAIVTGGAGGIGEATVRRFISEGGKVVFADWDGARGREVEADIKAKGGNAVFVEADVSNEAAVAGLVKTAVDTFGTVDILVNNAGIRLYQTVVDASAESWTKLLGVNLMSYVWGAKAAIPVMRKAGKGAIVNVASVRSITAGSKTVQYDTAKAAVAGLTRAMAMDHSTEGIRINAVGPGPIFTPFHAKRIAAAGQTVEQYNDEAARQTMMKRPGRSEEVAACIAFLASDDASYVAGTILYVDGGLTAI